MKEVDKKTFWDSIFNHNRNVSPSLVGKYPYTFLMKTPGGQIHGKIVESYPEGKLWPIITKYFLQD